MKHHRHYRTFPHLTLLIAIICGSTSNSNSATAFQVPLAATTRSKTKCLTSDGLFVTEGTATTSSIAATIIRKSRRNDGIAPLYNYNSNDNDYNSKTGDDADKINSDEEEVEEDDEFTKAVESNNLQNIINYLQSPSSSPPSSTKTKTKSQSLSKTQLRAIFDAIETATAETDENTVNKRTIQDQTILQASSSVEFRSLDRVRAQMTKLYGILREEGVLTVFGAVARPPPSSSLMKSRATSNTFERNGNEISDGTGTRIMNGSSYNNYNNYSSNNNRPTQPLPIYPTAGSKLITPNLLEQITNLTMSNLTPRPTNFFLYGGIALAISEGLLSLYFHINFNLLVVATLLLALADQLLVSGAVFETILRIALPELKTRITKHEAGHFLVAYLLGCPVEGVVLSTWAAMRDGRFGGRSSSFGTGAVSAGTSYYDLDLSEQIAGKLPLTRESIDRYSII
eukprot:CAMPEP_0171351056 /NCGR_PEP_ID=MMETSP0878-20121228/37987_1 /TAXON_ID=67004 /ORGANISM="Thalassiosira weissflogii, Strain CCMP1336" /LENGTH=454 /DNA_ID=CAMNT_0011856187 /DNA_START=156 /DNA_END=1517 /DNA_ORIENTATION=-